jgi:hypothetical protein
MADPFAARFAAARARFGPLVWGLDPSGELLDTWELGDSPDGLDRFADIMLDAAVGTVGLVKPQSAFYERHGWRGIRTLQRLVADARAAACPDRVMPSASRSLLSAGPDRGALRAAAAALAADLRATLPA